MRKSKGCKWDFGYIKGHWRIDALTAAELETAVDNCEVDPKALVFDWKHIFFAGLRVLLKAQRSMVRKGKCRFWMSTKLSGEFFAITGFSDIL